MPAGAGDGRAGTGAGSAAGPVQAGEAPTGTTNGPFATSVAAARAALNIANPQSVSANREYGVMIYRDANGQYYFTGPGAGTDQGFNPSTMPIPSGTQPAGDYHCHGDYSTIDRRTGRAVRTSDPAHDDFDSDNFSAPDRAGIAHDATGHPGYKGYLGTPGDQFKSHDPSTGSTELLP